MTYIAPASPCFVFLGDHHRTSHQEGELWCQPAFQETLSSDLTCWEHLTTLLSSRTSPPGGHGREDSQAFCAHLETVSTKLPFTSLSESDGQCPRRARRWLEAANLSRDAKGSPATQLSPGFSAYISTSLRPCDKTDISSAYLRGLWTSRT